MNSSAPHDDAPETQGWSLVYVADPMCAWCHGFAPAIEAVRARWPWLPLHPVMGGLRADDEPLGEAAREQERTHWQAVASRTGQHFDAKVLDRPDLIFNTEAACRAVVLMREHTPPLGLPMLAAVQSAFHAGGQDVTDPGVLAQLASTLGVRGEDFLRAHGSAAAMEATRRDFLSVHQWDVRGFPVLIAVHDGAGHPVVEGWAPTERVMSRLEERFSQTP